MDFTVGAVVGDRYQITGRLGEGGMAVVYEVVHTQLGTRHALKVLTINSRSVRDRMLQEGRFQAKLQHPNIVAVTDVVAVNDSPALVMELVDGPALDELLRLQKLTLDQADAIGRGILSAVAHAHGLGLIHRDLKPANVLLQIVDQTAIPKVTDFGLAKLLDGGEGRAATRTGSTMGTPQYMSPEQIRDAKNVDERADVFALGAILYELVTGDRAFDGDNVLDIFKAIDDGRYVDARTLRPDARPEMLAAIEAGLRGDRQARAQSAAELFALWTGGEDLPPHASAVSLGTLPSLSEFQTRAPTRTDVEPASAVSLRAPALVVGTGVVALAGAGAVIVGLLLVVGWLWMRPTETRIVEVPITVVDTREVPVVPAPDVVPSAEPVEVEPADTETLETEGVPWDEREDLHPVQPASDEEPADTTEDRPDQQPGEGVARRFAASADDRPPFLTRRLMAAWRSGRLHEPLVPEVLAAAGSDRVALLRLYADAGTSLQPPVPWLTDSDRRTANAAMDALVEVARRTGRRAEAKVILSEQKENLSRPAVRAAVRALDAP